MNLRFTICDLRCASRPSDRGSRRKEALTRFILHPSSFILFRWSLLTSAATWLVTGAHLHGQPSQTAAADDIPPLAPPLPEIPPTFWEQYQAHILLGIGVGLLLLAGFLHLALRRKPAPPVPPEVRVRAELQAMLGGPETGVALSRSSQSLRWYLASAFGLPPEALTTTEFCARLHVSEAVGPGLAGTVAGFLRECDERKFSPAPPGAPLNAAQRALELVAQAEVRRREPRASVLDGGGPPPLSACADATQERQGAGALQDADANLKPPTP